MATFDKFAFSILFPANYNFTPEQQKQVNHSEGISNFKFPKTKTLYFKQFQDRSWTRKLNIAILDQSNRSVPYLSVRKIKHTHITASLLFIQKDILYHYIRLQRLRCTYIALWGFQIYFHNIENFFRVDGLQNTFSRLICLIKVLIIKIFQW